MLILTKVDIQPIEADAIKDGKLQVLPYSYWQQFDTNTQLNFMHRNAYYIIPTTELIDWLITRAGDQQASRIFIWENQPL